MRPNLSLYPSVTEAMQIRVMDALRRIPPDVLKKAQDRGSEVHDLCASYAAGLFVIAEGDRVGYLDSFKKWFDMMVSEVLLSEERLIDDGFSFTGQPDFVFKMKNAEISLIDLKTPISLSKTWRLQLAAYAFLVETITGIKLDRIGSLRLSPEGKMARVDWCEGSRNDDFHLFTMELQLHRFYK